MSNIHNRKSESVKRLDGSDKTVNSNHLFRPPFNEDRLSRIDAALYLGLEVSTLATDVTTKRLGIPYVKVGSRVYYRRSQLDAWLEVRHVVPTGNEME